MITPCPWQDPQATGRWLPAVVDQAAHGSSRPQKRKLRQAVTKCPTAATSVRMWRPSSFAPGLAKAIPVSIADPRHLPPRRRRWSTDAQDAPTFGFMIDAALACGCLPMAVLLTRADGTTFGALTGNLVRLGLPRHLSHGVVLHRVFFFRDGANSGFPKSRPLRETLCGRFWPLSPQRGVTQHRSKTEKSRARFSRPKAAP